MTAEPRPLWSGTGGLLEAPRPAKGGGVLFADARHGGVRLLREDGGVDTVWPHRRGIGGVVPHEDGGLVVTGRGVSHRSGGSPTVELVGADADAGWRGFNDLTTDRDGRLYVGSLGEVAIDSTLDGDARVPGGVVLVDLDGTAREVASGISLTNGLALTPDRRDLYVSDSARRVVLRYPVDLRTGDLGEATVFRRFEHGVPDGMAVSEDGDLWLALAYAGQVVVLTPDGDVRRTVPLPEPLVTSVCFGGPELRTLYVTTGAQGPEDTASLFALDTGVPGQPVSAARVALPAPGAAELSPAELFRRIDTLDASAFAGLLAPDGVLRFSGAEPIVGREAVAASVTALYAQLSGMRHEIHAVRTEGPYTAVDLAVTYLYPDRPSVTVDVTTRYRWSPQGITDYRVSTDPRPTT